MCVDLLAVTLWPRQIRENIIWATSEVGFVEILQPFKDAIKLFNREQTFRSTYNYISYYFVPVLRLFLYLLI